MRISDWSSDVCSSDLINPAAILIGGRLPGKLVDGLVERLNARMTGVKLPVVAPVRRAGAADDASAIGAAIIPFLDHVLPSESILMQDRKSVVSDKSVSVRVARGGRRFIKNTHYDSWYQSPTLPLRYVL